MVLASADEFVLLKIHCLYDFNMLGTQKDGGFRFSPLTHSVFLLSLACVRAPASSAPTRTVWVCASEGECAKRRTESESEAAAAVAADAGG